MITPSFNLTATERVLPKLALDFTTASLDSRVTFTRTTDATHPATYINSSGVITAATDNEPRFDYDAVTQVCKGLLIEESRTNVLSYSEQFDDVSWAKTRSSISSNAIVAPDGNTTADKLIEDTSASLSHVVGKASGLSGSTVAFSVYAKAGERNYVALWNAGVSIFDLVNGTVTTVGAGATCSIVSVGNGWYRCTTVGTAPSSNYIGVALNGTTYLYTGDGTSGIYIWGAQVEAGAFATSYIPTTTAALTRNADVAVMTGTNFSDWFNASEGTFRSDFIPLSVNASQYTMISVDAGNGNDIIALSQGSGKGLLGWAVSGSGFGLFTTQTTTVNTLTGYCGCYKTNNVKVAIAGNTAATTSSASIPSGIIQARIGYSVRQGIYANGVIANIYYYSQALTAAEISAFSK